MQCAPGCDVEREPRAPIETMKANNRDQNQLSFEFKFWHSRWRCLPANKVAKNCAETQLLNLLFTISRIILHSAEKARKMP